MSLRGVVAHFSENRDAKFFYLCLLVSRSLNVLYILASSFFSLTFRICLGHVTAHHCCAAWSEGVTQNELYQLLLVDKVSPILYWPICVLLFQQIFALFSIVCTLCRVIARIKVGFCSVFLSFLLLNY